jgi:two-component system response regulator
MGEGRTIRLLIAEDNVADVLLMTEALRELCAVSVEIKTVSDGEQALSLLKTGMKFDVVILDLSLPKIDGFTVLERYRSHYLPIVVFSSSWNEADSNRALAHGAREFIRKPSFYDEYIEAVCGIVERWGSPNNAAAAEAP